jgi:hypothetical protein
MAKELFSEEESGVRPLENLPAGRGERSETPRGRDERDRLPGRLADREPAGGETLRRQADGAGDGDAARGLISGNARDPLADRKDDLYETPEVATEALLRVEPLPRVIWEPACGPGAIVRVLRAHEHTVLATDLVDYGCPNSESRIDFLMEQSAGGGVGAIVTNPPFKLAAEFVRHAVPMVPLVVMLLRLEFLAGARRGLLDRWPLARVYVFRNRLPRMHRAGWEGPRSTSRISFAWFCWDKAHSGPTELRRLSWESAS